MARRKQRTTRKRKQTRSTARSKSPSRHHHRLRAHKPRHMLEKLSALKKYEVHTQRSTRRILEHSAMAGLAVALVSILFRLSSDGLLLFASLGASAAVMGYFPKSRMNSVRTIVISYVLVILVSMVCLYLSNNFGLGLATMMFLAVFLSTSSMMFCDAFHPPAISASLGFMLMTAAPFYLIIMLACVISLIVMIKFLYYIHLEELEVEEFVREFTKHHYGLH